MSDFAKLKWIWLIFSEKPVEPEILALTRSFHFPDNSRKNTLSLLDVTACETETPIRVEYAGDCRFVSYYSQSIPTKE
jgi:hypothetical protein